MMFRKCCILAALASFVIYQWHQISFESFTSEKFPYDQVQVNFEEDLDGENHLQIIDKNLTILMKPHRRRTKILKNISVIILSAPKHFDKRNLTRNQLNLFSDKLDWTFVLGQTDPDVQSKLLQEQNQFGDLVQFSILDKYKNLAYKSLASFLWLASKSGSSTHN
jgi:hypothetical protein